MTRRDDGWYQGERLMVIEDNHLQRGIMALYHDSLTGGHPGILKTCLMIAKDYWWPNLKEFITNYIKGCAICQATKSKTTNPKPPLYPITTEQMARPFKNVSMDLIVKLPLSQGYDSIMTITDHDCSKAAIFLPCNETIDGPGVAELYAQHVFPHYGVPKKIISD